MGALYVTTWMVGLAGTGVVSAVIGSDSARVVRAARVAFAFLFAIELLVAAIFYESTPPGSGGLPTPPDSSSWWGLALGCGIPVALLAAVVVRRAYAGHRLALISAVLATAALYLAFPLGFVPPRAALTGLGRFEHAHHAFDVLALFAPALILLASEALRGRVAGPDEAEASLIERLRNVPRRVVVGTGIALAAAVVLLGASGSDAFFGVLVVGVGIVVAAWWQTRSAARRMRRNL